MRALAISISVALLLGVLFLLLRMTGGGLSLDDPLVDSSEHSSPELAEHHGSASTAGTQPGAAAVGIQPSDAGNLPPKGSPSRRNPEPKNAQPDFDMERILAFQSTKDIVVTSVTVYPLYRDAYDAERPRGGNLSCSSFLVDGKTAWRLLLPKDAAEPGPAKDLTGFRIIVPGHSTLDVTLNDLLPGEINTLLLAAGDALSGTVKDALTGRALEGVSVVCRLEFRLTDPRVGELGDPAELRPVRTTTDAAGRFSLLTSLNDATLTFSLDGYPDHHCDARMDENEELDIRMHPGILVDGHITSADGAPLAGGLLYFMTSDAGDETNPKMTVTDERGAFTMKDLLPGDYSLHVTMTQGLRRPEQTLKVDAIALGQNEQARTLELVVPNLVRLKGVVGVPPSTVTEGHFVDFVEQDTEEVFHLPFNVKTGAFDVELPAGDYQIVITRWRNERDASGVRRVEDILSRQTVTLPAYPYEQEFDIRP